MPCGREKGEENANNANLKGFLKPNSIRPIDIEFMEQTCIASGTFWHDYPEYKVWGRVVDTPFYAYSNDSSLRKRASSGWVISQIAIYLLENKLVDGVIESKVSHKSQIETQTINSINKTDVLNCSG